MASGRSAWRVAALAGGRGLLIVEALATDWGADVHEHGKTVWFELDVAEPNPVDRTR